MSSEEKRVWIELLLVIATHTAYVIVVLALAANESLTEVGDIAPMLWTIGIAIVGVICFDRYSVGKFAARCRKGRPERSSHRPVWRVHGALVSCDRSLQRAVDGVQPVASFLDCQHDLLVACALDDRVVDSEARSVRL